MRLRREVTPGGTRVAVAHEGGWLPLPAIAARPSASEALRAGQHDVVALLAGGPRLWDEIGALCAGSDAWAGSGGAAGPGDGSAGGAAGAGGGTVVPTLPFAPRSLRCFSGWQEHWEQGARNLARRYHPLAGPAIRAFEGLTRRTFPPLRPGQEFFEHPTYYVGNHLTVYTDGDTVPWPSYCEDYDYELEIGFIVAKPLFEATVAEGTAAIGGLVVYNDLSARDTQWHELRHGMFGPAVKSKSFAGAMSAEVVTADEVLPHLDTLAASVTVNGERRSSTSARGMQYSAGELLAHASRGEQVQPGELLVSGTLPRGSGLELDRLLAAGDVVTLEVERIGTLTTTVGRRGEPGRRAADAVSVDPVSVDAVSADAVSTDAVSTDSVSAAP